MPIERRSRDAQIRAVLIGVVALVFAVTLGYALFRAAFGSRSSVATQPGGRTFVVGSADDLAPEIDRDGPILLPDPSADGQSRPVFVWHPEGAAGDEAWVAYVARPPDAASDCFLSWDRTAEVLSADCATRDYAAAGEGLTAIPVEVDEDGRVVIDLSTDAPDDSKD